NAVAAFSLYGPPVIVVDFGTATTFCCIDRLGRYCGGAICPGVNISAEALYEKAAKLPRVELIQPGHIIGKTTVEAMQEGIFYGYVNLVDGIVRQMKQELRGAKVVATGGLAPLICHATTEVEEINLNLTLIGLRDIYYKNRIG